MTGVIEGDRILLRSAETVLRPERVGVRIQIDGLCRVPIALVKAPASPMPIDVGDPLSSCAKEPLSEALIALIL
jgi:hypothetical protein